nr:hypothetical protein RF1 [Carex gibba]ULQ64304.1 hypothetical protein RF1 [Carex gibba]
MSFCCRHKRVSFQIFLYNIHRFTCISCINIRNCVTKFKHIFCFHH